MTGVQTCALPISAPAGRKASDPEITAGLTLTPSAARPMAPASVMKLVTTFAALEILGREYRWRTEAYLGGPLVDGALKGDLILKGYGDPKITVEQWQAFMAALRAGGLDAIEGDLALDRSHFALPPYDPGRFDGEPSGKIGRASCRERVFSSV